MLCCLILRERKGAKVIVRAKVPGFVVPTSGLLWMKYPWCVLKGVLKCRAFPLTNLQRPTIVCHQTCFPIERPLEIMRKKIQDLRDHYIYILKPTHAKLIICWQLKVPQGFCFASYTANASFTKNLIRIECLLNFFCVFSYPFCHIHVALLGVFKEG